MKRLVALSFAFTLTLNIAPSAMAAAEEKQGDYIVVLKSSEDADRNEKAVKDLGGRVERKFKYAINALSVKIKASDVDRLLQDPTVLSIEIDQTMYASETQSPSPSWGLDRIDQRQLPLDSSFTTTLLGRNVDVYIVDTGINTSHTDFTGRIGAGFTSIADGNGVNDCNGHGTHVAGTAAGSRYGIAKQSAVLPVRVLGCTGSGSTSGVIAGLDWIVSHHSAGNPAVANMSLGGGTSVALDTAVQSVINDGVTVAVAAGNSNVDACNSSPARVANAVTVGSTAINDARSSFSNFGSCLDIFAPGTSITSSWIGSISATNTISGTSMASPHVAGVVAALLGQTPLATPAQIVASLRGSATTNVVSSVGLGSPNLLLHLEGATTPVVTDPPTEPSVPDAPVIGLATALTKRRATVTWSASSGGSSPILSYSVNAYSNGSATISLTQSVSASTLSVTFSGLVAGSNYTFRVQAKNAVGPSQLSAPSNSIIAKR
jgi:subtilisin family serine protease